MRPLGARLAAAGDPLHGGAMTPASRKRARRTATKAGPRVDEAAVAEWARWFDALPPEERASIDAAAARELAEHRAAAPAKRPRPRAALARKLPKT
jgi:hypothetical protein